MTEMWDRLQRYSRDKGITDRQMAEKLSVPYDTYIRWRRRDPSVSNIAKINRLLGAEDRNPLELFNTIGESSVRTGLVQASNQIGDAGRAQPMGESGKGGGGASSTGAIRLGDDDAKKLLAQHEIVRDPVWGDVWITALERMIIDTSSFQRLRLLKQLGPTHLVYPGAVHTRFLHSIGTVHCAEQLIQIANRNHEVYAQPYIKQVRPYAHLLTRLCALLHDVAHMPFGHTLENEGNLNKGEWKDPVRANAYFGEESATSIIQPILHFLKDTGIEATVANRLVDDLREYLLPNDSDKHPDYPMNLEYPFIVDIVGNTLCADLLDYLERDMLFAGMKERSGDRVMKYIAVVNVRPKANEAKLVYELADDKVADSRGRLALLTYRFESEHGPGGRPRVVTKNEILSEAIDLLRRRFALAEKVYFHRTKIAASAMLISAAGSSSLMTTQPHGTYSLDTTQIYQLSDDEFISHLEHDPNQRTRHLISAYKARRLYHPVFQLDYREQNDEDRLSVTFWQDMYPNSRNPAWRRDLEERLEQLSGLEPGTIVVYSPDRLMNMKEFEMLVQSHPDTEIKQLENILDPNRKKEMDAINERFLRLWRLQVLVDPIGMDVTDYGREDVQDLNALCEELIGFPNGISKLQGRGRRLLDQIARRVIREYEETEKVRVPFQVSEELVNASRRSTRKDIIATMRDHLRSLMTGGDLRQP